MPLNLKPKKYQEIVPDYETYLKLQAENFLSHESMNFVWKKGQETYIAKTFSKTDRTLKIADVACGDGVGLQAFREMGFIDATGVEVSSKKAILARRFGYRVIECDMHDLKELKTDEFEIVYSSHTLEHAYYPSIVLKEFHRILKPAGHLYVVLPYPDVHFPNDEAHGAKYELGTNVEDNGKSVIAFFLNSGFELITCQFDSYREPEIWLSLKKIQPNNASKEDRK